MKELEKIMKAFANRRRLEIIKYLKEKRRANVSDIARHIKLSFKSTSRHLAVLRAVSIVDREQRNLEVYYSILDRPSDIVRHLLKIV